MKSEGRKKKKNPGNVEMVDLCPKQKNADFMPLVSSIVLTIEGGNLAKDPPPRNKAKETMFARELGDEEGTFPASFIGPVVHGRIRPG